ncbi:helix-turn-helix domain-containing protein [Shimazuella kribbensis]|uniref:helix-turn-helix domain-containing protein n=1 Tax=Shimazuella kribbensis TaxID=139808 RepID=UPI00041BBA76|nr:helix-turn-helix domain-containing protein [Shimazuella kribbensis]
MKASVFVSYELGEKIRKTRKQRRITQEDLALSLDLSPSLISKIERGAYQVARDNFEVVCEFLGLDVEVLLENNQVEMDNQVDIRLLLKTIEHDIHLVGTTEVWAELNTINLDKNNHLLGEYYYLQGLIYEAKQSWGKAQEFYEKAIRFADQFQTSNDTNIKSISYYVLGRLFGKQGKLKQALTFIKLGEESFIEGVERSYLKYSLLLSKAIYLEKLNQNEEAFRITEELKNKPFITASTEAKTNLVQLHATLLNKFGLYDQSIQIAEEGVILARLDKLYDRTFELWTTKGESYRKKRSFANAKHCLKTALKLKEKIQYLPLAVSTYTQLGLLYLELTDIQKSQKSLVQAVELGKETKDNLRLMSALIALGNCYLQQQKLTKAQCQYEMALSIAQTHSYTQHEWDILMKLAVTCKQDNPDLYGKYVEQFHQLSLKLWIGGEKSMTFHQNYRIPIHLEAEPPDV